MTMWNYLTKLGRSLFPHAKPVRYALTVFVLLLIGAWATQCRAEEITFEGGVQYLRGPAAAVTVNVIYDGPKDATIETGLFLVGAVERSDRAAGDGVMGGQVLLVDGFGKFDVGLGLAYMNRIHQNLGSQMNFALMVRYNFNQRWYAAVRHWSNAGTTNANTGLDIITVGYRF